MEEEKPVKKKRAPGIRRAKIKEPIKTSIVKPRGIKADGSPNAAWQKFEERLQNFNVVEVKNWKSENVLGYIIHKFQLHYNVPYTFSYTGGPGKCPEMYCTNRMISALCGIKFNPEMTKEYIDYVYDKIIIPQNKNITSIAFFFTAKFIQEFKSKYNASKRITRSTQIPNDIFKIIEENGFDECITYGDLAFIKKAVDGNPDNSFYDKYRNLLNTLSSSMDLSRLDTLDD